MNGHDHPHLHPHPHGHAHPHAPGPTAEVAAGPGGGVAVLDIGDDVGALVVRLGPDHLGTELHVRPAGRPDAGTVHTGVWSRPVGGGEVVVAVFPHLDEGSYEILGLDGSPALGVSVVGGQVTEAVLA